jgi:hydroxyethylthiazole kinase-like uncharacterized protein yjeF
MERVLPAAHDWPLHGTTGSRLVEQQAHAGLPPHTLMERAGVTLAALARALHPHARSVWIACGPGNNGGDGLEAACHLAAAGLSVQVSLIGHQAGRHPADAQAALARAQAAGLQVRHDPAPSRSPDFAIDALLGLGSNRAPQGDIASAIVSLNALACPVLAVDLPTGLDGDTGRLHGGEAVAADDTLCLLTLKPGLFTGEGRDHAGTVWLSALSADARHTAPTAWLGGAGPLASARRHAQHKGSFGDVAVVGGATGMAGAAWLAARAAHAAGAGRVFVELLAQDASWLDAQRPELMVRPGWSRTTPAHTLARSTVVCGCGGGDDLRAALPRLLSAAGRLVLDADALNSIAADTQLATLLRSRRAVGHETVITPHPLEAARLLGIDTARVQADRIAAASALAERHQCVTVLKGSGTVIATPGATPWVNGTGNASLATAGTGDVLAGWLGGCWSAFGATALQAARHAVWLHGAAADRSRQRPLRAADLVEAMHGFVD